MVMIMQHLFECIYFAVHRAKVYRIYYPLLSNSNEFTTKQY